MNWELYFRYVLELSMILPASIFALLPVRNNLRFPPLRIGAIVLLSELVFVFLSAWVCVQQNIRSFYSMIAALLLFFPLFSYMVRLSWRKLVFCFSASTLLCVFGSNYVAFVLAPYEAAPALTYSPLSSLGGLLLTFAFGALFLDLLLRRLPYLFTQPRLEPLWLPFSLLLFVISAIYFWVTPMDLRVILYGRIRAVGLILFPLSLLFVGLLFYLLYFITRGLADGARLAQENDLLRMEGKRYDQLRSYMDETAVLRHDFRQHIHVLSALAAEGDLDGLRRYLAELEAPASVRYTPFCANPAVDAVAAHYDHQADLSQTDIDWAITLPAALPVSEMELCSVLGNLLENALRAVGELPPERRRILVVSRLLSDGMLGLSVENPYAGRIDFGPDGLPVSRRGHGIGLASVAAAVNRHHGTMNLSVEDGIFSVDLLMYF